MTYWVLVGVDDCVEEFVVLGVVEVGHLDLLADQLAIAVEHLLNLLLFSLVNID